MATITTKDKNLHFKVELPKTEQAKLVSQVVRAQLANLRRSTASTKTKGAVSGGGKKPWKQKGTGNARAGSSRSPIWVGGGVTFGPSTKLNWHKNIPSKYKSAAIKNTLAWAITQERANVFGEIKITSAKTKDAAAWIKQYQLKTPLMIVLKTADSATKRAFGNLKKIKLTTGNQINALDLVKSRSIAIEQSALADIFPLAKLTPKTKKVSLKTK